MVDVPIHCRSVFLGGWIVAVFAVLAVLAMIALGPHMCGEPIRTVNGVSYCGPPPDPCLKCQNAAAR